MIMLLEIVQLQAMRVRINRRICTIKGRVSEESTTLKSERVRIITLIEAKTATAAASAQEDMAVIASDMERIVSIASGSRMRAMTASATLAPVAQAVIAPAAEAEGDASQGSAPVTEEASPPP